MFTGPHGYGQTEENMGAPTEIVAVPWAGSMLQTVTDTVESGAIHCV